MQDAPPPSIRWIHRLELGYSVPPQEAAIQQKRAEEPCCFHCGATASKLLRCGRCQVAGYCQKECQVADWKESHKKACASYQRVGPSGILSTPSDQAAACHHLWGQIRFYACPYAVHRSLELGPGFLFLQSDCTLATLSLAIPKDTQGYATPPRSILLHYLTLGEYDVEVCRDDFELASVRSHLRDAVEQVDGEQEVVVLLRLRCGHVALGVAPLVPDYRVCRKLGADYYAEQAGGALQLNLDDV